MTKKKSRSPESLKVQSLAYSQSNHLHNEIGGWGGGGGDKQKRHETSVQQSSSNEIRKVISLSGHLVLGHELRRNPVKQVSKHGA